MKAGMWLAALVCLTGGMRAMASGLTCSSNDQRLSYVYSTSDGGPMVAGPAEDLTLEGKVLIKREMLSTKPLITLATEEFEGEAKTIDEKKTDTWDTTYFVQTLKVTSSEEGHKVLFEDYVFCTENRYIGPPIP